MKNKKFEFVGTYDINNCDRTNQIYINNIKFEFKEKKIKIVLIILKSVFLVVFPKINDINLKDY